MCVSMYCVRICLKRQRTVVTLFVCDLHFNLTGNLKEYLFSPISFVCAKSISMLVSLLFSLSLRFFLSLTRPSLMSRHTICPYFLISFFPYCWFSSGDTQSRSRRFHRHWRSARSHTDTSKYLCIVLNVHVCVALLLKIIDRFYINGKAQ